MTRLVTGKSMVVASAIASLLVAPAAVLALTPAGGTLARQSAPSFASFTPAGVDSRLAAELGLRPVSKPPRFRFTPAGIPTGTGRTITVAVRAMSQSANAIGVRAPTAVRLTPTSYSLGVARGWQSFATPAFVSPAKSSEVGSVKFALGDVETGNYRIERAEAQKRIRTAPRVSLDARQNVTAAPRAIAEGGDYAIDLAGRYRLTRRIDVTAGVRYNADTEQTTPLTDDRQDSQAVYVGTRIRF